MSRIGKMPIDLPQGVTVDIKGNFVTVKGSKGTLSLNVHRDIMVAMDDGQLVVNRPTESRQHRSLHGLSRSLLFNMVHGVSRGFERRLEVQGVGYRAEMQGKTLVLYVGFSHPVEVEPPDDHTSFEVEDRGRLIIVRGIDKQVVGETTAKIRKVRPPEPYKGKGIRYLNEVVRRKAGKAGKV